MSRPGAPTRILLLLSVPGLLVGLAACGGPAHGKEDAPAPSAARGLRHLLETPYVPWHFDQATFDELWRDWPAPLRSRAAQAGPAERRRMAFARYGFTARPGSTRPVQYVVDARGRWTIGCLACHQGRVAGRSIPGLPNAHLALQTLAEDVLRTKRRLKKPLGVWDLATAAGQVPFGETVGTTNAVVFGIVLLRWRNEDLEVVAPKAPGALPHHDLDAPPWWHYRRKTHLYVDGFARKGHRALMPFLLVPQNGRAAVLRYERDFRDIEAWIEDLAPPAWPYAVDASLAQEGRGVFLRHCADCHGTYGKDGRYPERLVPIAIVGTDPVRLVSVTPAERRRYARSWLTGYDPTGVRVDPGGYVAPPLDGVWASAPYFHNGAVPTLWHVLHPDRRPARWKRAFAGYDRRRVGLAIETRGADAPLPEEPSARRRWFDTTRRGKSAAGHRFPDRLTEGQKRALLEYLKTL